jgi:hypothetical protein
LVRWRQADYFCLFNGFFSSLTGGIEDKIGHGTPLKFGRLFEQFMEFTAYACFKFDDGMIGVHIAPLLIHHTTADQQIQDNCVYSSWGARFCPACQPAKYALAVGILGPVQTETLCA